jgi:opacity protein-like surface antigen
MKKIILAVLMAAAMSAAANADGGEYFAFLKLGMGTRATGMGSAFTSIADDSSAIFYNPAGTLNLKGLEFMAETYFLTCGRNVNYVATAKPFVIAGSNYAVGAAWVNYSAGSDIEQRLTNSTQPDAVISDACNEFIFNASSKLSRFVAFGGNFKVLLENIGSQHATGVGFDLGGIINVTENLKIGVSYAGIGTSITWNNGPHTESVPQVTTVGASYMLSDIFGFTGVSVQPAADTAYTSLGNLYLRCGAEAAYKDMFFLRAGYNGAFTCGAGIRLKPSDIFSIKIDYAFVADTIEPGGSNHRVGAVILYTFPASGITGKKQLPEESKIEKNNTKAENYEW